ncbi:MAG: hypothetical protein H6834_08620 [Planctomycetes bacterium]|nr:hypothetical protein [Planctomycetota bacterium]
MDLPFSCSRGDDTPPKEDVEHLLRILAMMRDADRTTRERGLQEFLEFARNGLGPETGRRALEEAARAFPDDETPDRDPATSIVLAVAERPDTSFVEPLARCARHYPASAVGAALTLLTRIERDDAARAFLRIVKENAARLTTDDWNVEEWQDDPVHEDILFPTLFEFTEGTALEGCAYELALYYAKVGALAQAKQFPAGDAVAAHLERVLDPSRVDAIASEPQTRWSPEYAEQRWEAGLLLDLLGFLEGKAVMPLLRRHVDSPDPRLACFAMLSLLRKHEDVPTPAVLRVAADAEMRNWFHEELRELGADHLFPADSRTLESYAEADVVNWLTAPTQLGRAPDELELDSFHEIVDEHGKNNYALFRFRMLPPHWAAEDGWLAAIAGPFEGRKLPEGATRRISHTFSNYNPWEALEARDHVIDVLKAVRDEDYEGDDEPFEDDEEFAD